MAPLKEEDMSVHKRLSILAALQGEADGLQEKREMDEALSRMRNGLIVR